MSTAETLANATVRYLVAGQRQKAMSGKNNAAALFAITADRPKDGGYVKQEMFTEENNRVHAELKEAEVAFWAAAEAHVKAHPESIPRLPNVEMPDHLKSCAETFEQVKKIGLRL